MFANRMLKYFQGETKKCLHMYFISLKIYVINHHDMSVAGIIGVEKFMAYYYHRVRKILQEGKNAKNVK